MKDRDFTKMTHRVLANSIKKELMKNDWWNDVQDDIKTKLDWIVDNIEVIGTMYIRAYMVLFRWEFERRKLSGQRIENPVAGYLATMMGMKISEEAYQCGILPTRSILDLYDFVSPNESDVSACLFLCHKIELLEKVGVLNHNDAEMKINPSEMAKALKSKEPEKPSKMGEETISWDFEE